MIKRPILTLYILAVYILVQFCWWAYLLTNLNQEVYEHRIENVRLRAEKPDQQEKEVKMLERKIHGRRWMVIGEGGVFLAILAWGSYLTLRSIRKEVGLARQQKNFLLSITHEFKSPLASIKLYLQTILRHELEKPKFESFINSAIHDTERLNNLVENALMANMIDHTGYSFSKEELNLSAFLRLMIQRYQGLPDHHSVEAKIEDGIILDADRNAFSVLINNLIENAAKYSPVGSAIGIELTREPHHVLICISDQGAGVPDGEKKKIFEKFYRVGNEETRKTKGTGLGLFIVRYITEHHDGVIYVEDNKPSGSIFCVRLKTPRQA